MDIHAAYHDYPQAVRCFEKLLGFYETTHQAVLAKGIDAYTKELNSETFSMNQNNYVGMLHQMIRPAHAV